MSEDGHILAKNLKIKFYLAENRKGKIASLA